MGREERELGAFLTLLRDLIGRGRGLPAHGCRVNLSRIMSLANGRAESQITETLGRAIFSTPTIRAAGRARTGSGARLIGAFTLTPYHDCLLGCLLVDDTYIGSTG